MTNPKDILGAWVSFMGDETFWGWLITLTYALTVLVAFRCVQRLTGEPNKKLRAIWLFIAISFLVLGINKQLDLQTLFFLGAHQLDILIRQWGGGGRRGFFFIVEAISFLAILLSTVVGLVVAFRVLWGSMRLAWIELIGMAVLVFFYLLRIGTFYGLFWRVEDSDLFRHIHALEFIGLVIVHAAGWIVLKRNKGRREGTPQGASS